MLFYKTIIVLDQYGGNHRIFKKIFRYIKRRCYKGQQKIKSDSYINKNVIIV